MWKLYEKIWLSGIWMIIKLLVSYKFIRKCLKRRKVKYKGELDILEFLKILWKF